MKVSGLSDDDTIALLERIEAFELDDPGAQFPFTSRLAGEQGWSQVFAGRAVREYKRFVALAMVSGHPVSPSPVVDQVWHLHLVYTRSYWKDMCRDLLGGRELHHFPASGSVEEGAKFQDWYGRTLESYRRFFGSGPPPEIWPSPGDRLRAPSRLERWVNPADFWLVPRPLWTRREWWWRRRRRGS